MIIKIQNNNSNSKLVPKYSYNDIPLINWTSTENRKTMIQSYSIIMFDPNSVVPNWIHLYAPYINKDFDQLDLSLKYNRSNVIVGMSSNGNIGYQKPAPPYGTHCYIFIVIGLNCKFNKYPKDAKQFIYDIYHNNNVVDINSVIFYYNKENKNNNQAKTHCMTYKINTIQKLYDYFYK